MSLKRLDGNGITYDGQDADSDSDSFDVFDMSRRCKRPVPQPHTHRTRSDSSADAQKPKKPKSKFTRALSHSQSSVASSNNKSHLQCNQDSHHVRESVHLDNVIILSDDDTESISAKAIPLDGELVRQAHVDAARAKLERDRLLLKQALEQTALNSSALQHATRVAENVDKPLEFRKEHSDVEEPTFCISVQLWTDATGAPATSKQFQFSAPSSMLLKNIMEKVCQLEKVQVQDYVFLCGDVKVFLFPFILHLIQYQLLPLSSVETIKAFQSTGEKSVTLNAFSVAHYHKLLAEREANFTRTLVNIQNQENEFNDEGKEPSHANTLQSDKEDSVREVEGITVVLRTREGDETKLRVKASTSIAAIVKTYAELKRIDAACVRLEFDHEILDAEATVQQYEIEDEDLIDVKYLKLFEDEDLA
ncbi:hypothetical protein HDU83_006248 [Entophlyctis luteolus]|nr:hypothetical protein HDU83_006248 [Entophlyctis luteolus]